MKLLDCYVLDAIGQLEDSNRQLLQSLEPKLRETYGVTGSWIEIVATQMEFTDALPGSINALWHRHLDQAREQGLSVLPIDFAIKVVDENFCK